MPAKELPPGSDPRDAEIAVLREQLRAMRIDDINRLPTELVAAEHKRANAALVASEERYRTLVEQLPVAVMLADPTGRVLTANRSALELNRVLRVEDLVGRHVIDLIAPEAREHVSAVFCDSMGRGVVPTFQSRVLRDSGDTLDAELSGVVLKNSRGEVTGFLAIAADISDRARARAEAATREAIWRLFLEAGSLESIYERLAQELTTHLGFDIASVELFDATRDEMIFVGVSGMNGVPLGLRVPAGRTLSGIVAKTRRPMSDSHADERMESVHDDLRQLRVRTFICVPFQAGDRGTGALVLADRAFREDAAAWVQNLETVAHTLALEVSRRQTLEALHTSEARFRCYIEQASEALFVFDSTGRLLDVNRQSCLATGYSREELLERTVLDLSDPVLSAQLTAAMARPGNGVIGTLSGEACRKDGSRFPTETTYVALELEGERRFLALARDITRRLGDERERLRLSSAIEQSGESIVMTDPELHIQYVNSAFERVTGYTKAEALGKTPRMLSSGEHDATFYQEMWQALERTGTWRGRFINRHKEGRLFLEDTTISVIRDARGRVMNYVAAKRDVTQQVQMEEQLRQAQKLEAIGQLAGGVAHDFNNLLAVIMMQVEMLKFHPHLDHEMEEALTEMERTAKRGAALTQQMLLFSRRTTPLLRSLDLNELVVNLVKMLRRLIPENVSVRFDGGPDVPVVEADAGMLEQVLINLAVNARDAMPDGGRLTISTASTTIGDAECRGDSARRPGRFACLALTDDGAGMDADTLKRIFEPFFTTKEVGKGTGLGLATVYGIVGQHQGWVEVESVVGGGTTFRVYLPAATGAVMAQTLPDGAAKVRRGSETILLVEDDAEVRRSLGRVLRLLGFRVLDVASGDDAVRLWPTVEAEVDLVITDVVMPGTIDGHRLTERLRAAKPGLKVIISSGYNPESANGTATLQPGIVYLAKPYEVGALAGALRRCLDGEARTG
jgi:two-component system, cell cycle sensor histidine kinase and response regulator CckA